MGKIGASYIRAQNRKRHLKLIKVKNKIMNKLFLSIATMLMMGFSAFAGNNGNKDEVVNQQALRSFKFMK